MFRLLLSGCLLFVSACGGGGQDDTGVVVAPVPPPPPPPPSNGALSGLVVDESNGARVPGAVVTVGGASTTASQEGQFTLAIVPVGAVNVGIVAPGFDTLTISMLIKPGSNSRTFSLMRANTVFEDDPFTIYLTPDISTIHGVFVVVFGQTGDSRPMIRGDLEFYRAFPQAARMTEYRQPLMEFARAHGFAVMGMLTTWNRTALPSDMRRALMNASGRSGHAELAQAPLLLMGHSVGGCMVYDIAVRDPERVIGVVPLSSGDLGACLDGSPDLAVPVYFIVGEFDFSGLAAASTVVFEQYRARGAPWALAVERGGTHELTDARNLIFNWAAAVAERRLPESTSPGAPVKLRPVSESSGWLGDRTSFSVAGFACFTGDKGRASWLPTEQNARDWQAMTSTRSSPVVTVCPP